MEEVTFDRITELVTQFEVDDKKWHFHMLSPDCMFNDKEFDAFVLENTDDNKTYVVYSDKPNMELGKELVAKIHGGKILEVNTTKGESDNKKIQPILDKINKLNEQKIHWHHHMLFPQCIFNKHIGKWNIIFEDEKIIEVLYDEEPIDDLREIEVLYYTQE